MTPKLLTIAASGFGTVSHEPDMQRNQYLQEQYIYEHN